jgi:hypothetical protein
MPATKTASFVRHMPRGHRPDRLHRPTPHDRGPECRRVGYAEAERVRRQQRKRKINRLRELVDLYDAALVAR